MSQHKQTKAAAQPQAGPIQAENTAAPDQTGQPDTEQKILDAARKIFLRQGMAGARMQAIADAAGINKAMLHYYYRNKQKLFNAVFKEAVGRILSVVFTTINSDETLDAKIPRFYQEYISILQQHPDVPGFVLSEIRQNPAWISQVIDPKNIPRPQKFLAQLQEGDTLQNLNCSRPEHLMVNMLSLALFPFIAAPLIKGILGFSDAEFAEFIEERKTHLPTFFKQAMQPS